HYVTAASPVTTRSPSATRSFSCRCTTDPAPKPLLSSPTSSSARPPSPAGLQHSTTCTCSSRARRLPRSPRTSPQRRLLMTAVADTVRVEALTSTAPHRRAGRGALGAVSTLALRRLALAVRTPRELLVPLLAPLLFAVVVAPALADTVGRSVGGVDYMT